MESKIVLRRSQRDNILWHFFVVLDHVGDGAQGRNEFATEMLTAFGVDPPQRDEWAKMICDSLPENLHELDANNIMDVFERVLPLEWENDLYQVGAEQSAEFRHSILGILAARTPDHLPREVSRLVIDELKRVVGGHVNAEALPRAAEALAELFVSELWRSKDVASQTKLTDHVLFRLKSTAQLEFAVQREEE